MLLEAGCRWGVLPLRVWQDWCLQPLSPGLDLCLGRLAARELPRSKDSRSTLFLPDLCITCWNFFWIISHDEVLMAAFYPYVWAPLSRESALVWHFTSCVSCILDAIVDILKTVLLFCGAMAFITFSLIPLGFMFSVLQFQSELQRPGYYIKK